jgi:hypothetical protein
MKFAKLNHMSIITLFAIAFIVVYLYYTISDVKKIHSEVKKMGQDIDKLNQSITNITTSILPMLTFPSSQVAVSQPEHAVSPPVNVQTLKSQQIYNQEDAQQDDDDTSVGSHELNKIMETIDVDDGHIDNKDDADTDSNTEEKVATFDIELSTTVVAEQPIADIGSLSAEDLKKVPYNDIRKYCKSNSIDDKGSKEVLIYRIKNPPKP